MALLSVIRRWHFRDGMPILEIERRTGLLRNTVRKYLRAGTVEPTFKVLERPSKLDPFAEKLSGWLVVEAGKSRKQRRTLKQMHTKLSHSRAFVVRAYLLQTHEMLFDGLTQAFRVLEHFPIIRNQPAPPPDHPMPGHPMGGREGVRAGADFI